MRVACHRPCTIRILCELHRSRIIIIQIYRIITINSLTCSKRLIVELETIYWVTCKSKEVCITKYLIGCGYNLSATVILNARVAQGSEIPLGILSKRTIDNCCRYGESFCNNSHFNIVSCWIFPNSSLGKSEREVLSINLKCCCRNREVSSYDGSNIFSSNLLSLINEIVSNIRFRSFYNINFYVIYHSLCSTICGL